MIDFTGTITLQMGPSMHRSRFPSIVLPVVHGLLLILSAIPSTVFARDDSPRRPNLVFLLADQLRYASVGYAGDTRALTPNLDRLAQQGLNFNQFTASTPVCAAYRASLFTGKYASSTGMVVNELRINPNQDCLAHVLSAHGYRTGYLGKWHLWANEAGNHLAVRNAFIPPGPYRLGFDDAWAAYNFNHTNYRAWYFRDTPEPHRIDGYGPDHFTGMAIDFLERHARSDRPFALMVSYSPPHDAWTRDNVPPEWLAKFEDVAFDLPPTWSDTPDPRMDRHTDPERWRAHWKANLEDYQRVYYAMTANLDWNVGRILEALKRLGLEDDTLVVFTSDHGEMFGAQGRVFKMTFYEESVRVPMLMRRPGHIPAGTTSDACMTTTDIMPTLLGLLRLPIPPAVEGMDLSHIALGREGPQPDAALLQGMGHTYQWKDGYEWRALRDRRYTYAVYRSDRKEFLFDRVNDPQQSRNLVDDAAARTTLTAMRAGLKARMDALNDTFQACSWYRDHWTRDRVIVRGARGTFTRTLGPDVPVLPVEGK